MLTLIRHAESAANAGLATHDPASIPLTLAGHLHAEQLAHSAFPSSVEKVWSSPYLRAVQTATPTANRYGLTIQELPIHEFTYICPDRCAGTNAAERLKWVESYWTQSNPNHVDGPRAESFSMFVERARHALALLEARKSQGQAVAFSHGQFLQMIYWLSTHPVNPVSKNGMRAYRALDRRHPILHCEGLVIDWPSSATDAKITRWPHRGC